MSSLSQKQKQKKKKIPTFHHGCKEARAVPRHLTVMEPLIRIYPKGWQVPLSHGLLGHSFSSAHQLVIHQVSELTRLAAHLMATCDILLQSLPASTTSEFGSIPLISPQGAHIYPSLLLTIFTHPNYVIRIQ